MSLRYVGRICVRSVQGLRDRGSIGMGGIVMGSLASHQSRDGTDPSSSDPSTTTKPVPNEKKQRVREAEKAETVMQLVCWGPKSRFRWSCSTHGVHLFVAREDGQWSPFRGWALESFHFRGGFSRVQFRFWGETRCRQIQIESFPSFSSPAFPLVPLEILESFSSFSALPSHFPADLSLTPSCMHNIMEKDFNGLPPLKRFKLLQQNSPSRQDVPIIVSRLPAKKRMECCRHTTATYCLPAKKRVWAPAIDAEGAPTIPEKKSTECVPDLNEPYGGYGGDSRDRENEIPNDDDAHLEEEEDGIICSVCQSTDGDPADPIVFCDGCDLMAHATCYGNPLIQSIPEGDWFCSRCEFLRGGSEKDGGEDLDCCLCPLKGGAAKPTVDGRWAHIMCSLLVPEVFFRDPEGREGIDCSRVPSKRWEGVCYVCESRRGCVLECSEPKCSSAFHVSCGLNEELCIEYREGRGGAIVAGFCMTHTKLWEKQQETGKFKIVAREGNTKV
ncbi:hypothetical protein ACLOJK_039788 [Asimina triloba]